MKAAKQLLLLLLVIIIVYSLFPVHSVFAQSAMINISSRNTTSLSGQWKVIIDPSGSGDYRQVWLEKKPEKKTDFFEYSFEGGPLLNVPGDFNSQMCELTHFEGTVWYKKEFSHTIQKGKRFFLHFGAVNYMSDVYLNGKKIGSHEGGYTPFQFEITDKLKNGENVVIVKANNNRHKNGVPSANGFDWFNYGGITRDAHIIETNSSFIEDYHIQLKKGSTNTVLGWIQLNGALDKRNVKIKIPELDLIQKTETDYNGYSKIEFSASFELWSPENPKLYKVTIESEFDTVEDEIGFRSIEVQGNKVLLNKKPIYIKGVNIHEENPYKRAKAYSQEDAALLLGAAKELGCNLVRLAHYPHNEYMVKEAEKMGMMIWSEIPVYQHIVFADSTVPGKIELMLKEMIRRDRNRCGVVIWCLSNETYFFTPNRTNYLIDLTQTCTSIDSTRLITHVISTQGYNNNTFDVSDTLYRYSDITCINEYVGWYDPWQGKPENTKWKLVCPDKPVLISEFGGEALFGSKYGHTDEAAYYTEEYQEQIYIDQTTMFNTIPNLCGVCPWLLFDYRSLGRMHPVYQGGYNRKGLISEKGEKKKAWFVMEKYFERK